MTPNLKIYTWKGNAEENEKPNEDQFKEHFDNLLNPGNVQCNENDISAGGCIRGGKDKQNKS